MPAVCVFLASSVGNEPHFREAAAETGRLAAERGMPIVYGGGLVGCMGALAKSALAAGGRVVGVIPEFMRKKEIALTECTELIVVDSMHERKMRMHAASDAFIVLAGGVGTLEEVFEIITWRQLGIHRKPIIFVNTHGYYDHLFAFIDHAKRSGFIRGDFYTVVETPAEAFAAVEREIARLLTAPPEPSEVLERAQAEARSLSSMT
eukprot:Unigene4898_Nuclearia_a/m.14988 Unigene4898_Nuclearia_a/g.14988  ORF Unigene4898_Nuclearia_a/g.14988 Unigene4898_Nuclearia_a/m.14988 type:complete len:206 (+) Unigene4898_Nuclearia_a:29-646(+)